MTRYCLAYLFIVSLCVVRNAHSQSTRTTQEPAISAVSLDATDSKKTQQARTPNAALDAPAITIDGLCDNPPANKTAASNCKTVITQAQFEKVIDAIQPNMPTRTRREFAMRYADALVMAKKAEQTGLDKGANYEEQLKLARIQILSQDMRKAIQEKVSQISDKDIEDYYDNNTARFQRAQVDRVYVPKHQKAASTNGANGSEDSEQSMKLEAESLRARAVAGEEFNTLQTDAYLAAGINNSSPNTSLIIRRTSLPPNQAFVIDLTPGEISAVIVDLNGYVFYKVKTKDMVPLDQVREEITTTLRSERMQDAMRSIQSSSTPLLNENYFAR